MNCREFNELLNELASDRLLDALARKRALVHAGGCESCARQLAAQRALSAGLVEFAEVTSRELPPARIKHQLRAVVAERRTVSATSSVSASASATVLAFKPAAKPQWQRQAWAIAATILVLFTVSTVLWKHTPNAEPRALAGKTTPTPQTETVVDKTPVPAVGTAADLPPGKDQLAQRQVVKQQATRRVRVSSPVTVGTRADEQELVSEFVPLTLDTDERALANGTLVRLEVPRARLIALGLPLRVEAERDTINAEVMMGDNGVAYAIRVVR